MGLFWSEREVSQELMTEDYKIWEKVDGDWLLCVTSCKRIKGNIMELFESRLKTLKKGVIIHVISSKCKEVLAEGQSGFKKFTLAHEWIENHLEEKSIVGCLAVK